MGHPREITVKQLIPLVACMLAACSLSPEDFASKKRDVACEVCEGQGNFDCEQIPEESPEEMAGCDYDEDAARECLKGDWVCNTDTPPIVFAEQPDICDDVWDCDKGDE